MGACSGATQSHRLSWRWPSNTARSRAQRARPELGVSQPSHAVNNCGRSAGPSMSSPAADGGAACRQRTAITAYLRPQRNDRLGLSERSHLPPSRHRNAGYQILQCSGSCLSQSTFELAISVAHRSSRRRTVDDTSGRYAESDVAGTVLRC
jgi:hypothetical protein